METECDNLTILADIRQYLHTNVWNFTMCHYRAGKGVKISMSPRVSCFHHCRETPVNTAESSDLGMNADCTLSTDNDSQMLVGVTGFFGVLL